jgi:hypothetical protein
VRVRRDEMSLISRLGWFGGGTYFYLISMRMRWGGVKKGYESDIQER